MERLRRGEIDSSICRGWDLCLLRLRIYAPPRKSTTSSRGWNLGEKKREDASSSRLRGMEPRRSFSPAAMRF